MSSNRSLLKWWLIIVLTASGVVIANYFDGIKFVWENDFTKLSFVIVGLFVLTSAMVGYKLFTTSKTSTDYLSYETEWLLSEHLLSLGLLGTVCGLLWTFLGSFQDLDISNVQAAQEVIVVMSEGLGGAMTTTLIGLLFSMILKTQLVVAEGDS